MISDVEALWTGMGEEWSPCHSPDVHGDSTSCWHVETSQEIDWIGSSFQPFCVVNEIANEIPKSFKLKCYF